MTTSMTTSMTAWTTAEIVLTAAGALAAVTLGYLTACVITPTRPCRHCHGTGMITRRRLTRSLSRTPTECRACAGNGSHLKAGAWWLTTLRHRR